jgi:uncharacterized protein (DUF433 family)
VNRPLNRHDVSLFGRGLYSVGEAARIARVPGASIRRWLLGYSYRRGGETIRRPAVWHGDLRSLGGRVQVSFHDMLEARIVGAFRRHGVSWAAIREAARRAVELFGSNHPFTLKRFRTDGRRIFADIEESRDIKVLDINRSHFVFEEVVTPSLFEGIELEADRAIRWVHPHGDGLVVVDPARSFGRPILRESGVPTDVIAASVAAENSEDSTAAIFGIPPRHVHAAVEFEQRLAA